MPEHLAPARCVPQFLLGLDPLLPLQSLGRRRARADADDAHAVVQAFRAEGLGQGDESGVADAAADVVGRRMLAGIADDVDDNPAAPSAHRRVDFAREVDEAEDLQVPPFEPSLVIDHLDVPGLDGAGVVDQNVDAIRLLRQLPGGFGGAQIRCMDGHFDAVVGHEFGPRLFQVGLGARGKVKMAAFGRQHFSHPSADSLRPPRDQSGFPNQLKVHFVGPFLVSVR